MKIIFFQVDSKKTLPKLIKNSPNNIDMIRFIGIDQDVIQVHNQKNILLLHQNLVDILLDLV